MNKPSSGVRIMSIGLIAASAIIGLALLAFWSGYQIGRDIGRSHFAHQRGDVEGSAR